MKLKSFIRPFIGLLATLFLWMQISSISHATAYADLPYEHDGAVCVIATLATDAVIVPLVEIDNGVKEHIVVPTTFAPYAPVFYGIRHGRAPPPRAPPTLSKI